MFPRSKTFYIEENTSRGEEHRHFSIEKALNRAGTPEGKLGAEK